MDLMKAVAVTPGVEHSARLIDTPKPVPAKGQARVKVIRVGIDGTDIEIDRAEYGEAPAGEEHLVIGHESFGVVESVGTDVEDIGPGDYVAATVRRPDDCHHCKAGEQDMCITGDYTERGIKGRHGFLSEYYVESPEYLVKLPPVLKEAGVMLEPLTVVEKGIRHSFAAQTRMKAWRPRKALILGAGPIGLLGAMLIRLKGLEAIVYSRDPNQDIADRVSAIGATYVAKHDEKGEIVHHLGQMPQKFGPFDFLLEATGFPEVALGAMRIIGLNGILCLTSVTGGESPMQICPACLNLDVVLGNRVILGSVNANRIDFEQGVEDLIACRKRWPGWIESLITRRVSLQHFRETFHRHKGDMKVVVEMSEGS